MSKGPRNRNGGNMHSKQEVSRMAETQKAPHWGNLRPISSALQKPVHFTVVCILTWGVQFLSSILLLRVVRDMFKGTKLCHAWGPEFSPSDFHFPLSITRYKTSGEVTIKIMKIRVGEITRQVGHFLCTSPSQVQSPVVHKFGSWEPSGIISEYRASNKYWAPLGMAPKLNHLPSKK